MVAAMTLIEPPRKLAASRVAALRADEPLGPTIPIECHPALLFSPVLLLEKGRQRQAVLELDMIASHGTISLTVHMIPV